MRYLEPKLMSEFRMENVFFFVSLAAIRARVQCRLIANSPHLLPHYSSAPSIRLAPTPRTTLKHKFFVRLLPSSTSIHIQSIIYLALGCSYSRAFRPSLSSSSSSFAHRTSNSNGWLTFVIRFIDISLFGVLMFALCLTYCFIASEMWISATRREIDVERGVALTMTASIGFGKITCRHDWHSFAKEMLHFKGGRVRECGSQKLLLYLAARGRGKDRRSKTLILLRFVLGKTIFFRVLAEFSESSVDRLHTWIA